MNYNICWISFFSSSLTDVTHSWASAGPNCIIWRLCHSPMVSRAAGTYKDWSSPCFHDCRGKIGILLSLIINTSFLFNSEWEIFSWMYKWLRDGSNWNQCNDCFNDLLLYLFSETTMLKLWIWIFTIFQFHVFSDMVDFEDGWHKEYNFHMWPNFWIWKLFGQSS